MTNENKKINKKEKYKEVPVLKLRMMTDDEWNALAYKNYLQRKYGCLN